jgi:hypothetical protein
MDLAPYVHSLRDEFLVAAEAHGEETLALAERLVAPLESSVRLTLLNVLSTAADEITRDLAPGSVDIRLRGLDPRFVVTPPPAEPLFDEESAAGSGAADPPADAEGTPARINFRPPEHLKARIEDAAGREGLSVNAWLVRAVTAALNADARRFERRTRSGQQHYSVWVR